MMFQTFKRWHKILAFCLILSVAAGAGIVLSVQPTLAALICPQCFGLELLTGRVYVDEAMPQPLREKLARDIREGEQKVTAFYGELRGSPKLLVCATEACWQRLGGSGAKGISYANLGLRLAPAGIDPVIIAHELSHIEFHQRLGLGNFIAGTIPAWFDEGLAVIVSNDPRYVLASTQGNQCRVNSIGDFPAGMMEWTRSAGTDQGLYGRAACRVLRWMNANGGRDAALRLIRKAAAGATFEELYHDPALENS